MQWKMEMRENILMKGNISYNKLAVVQMCLDALSRIKGSLLGATEIVLICFGVWGGAGVLVNSY